MAVNHRLHMHQRPAWTCVTYCSLIYQSCINHSHYRLIFMHRITGPHILYILGLGYWIPEGLPYRFAIIFKLSHIFRHPLLLLADIQDVSIWDPTPFLVVRFPSLASFGRSQHCRWREFVPRFSFFFGVMFLPACLY